MKFCCAGAVIGWLLVGGLPCWAQNQSSRFLDFPSGTDTTTFDLSSVKTFLPGRFSIDLTAIDNPDVMRTKLKVFDLLGQYCSRPDGDYPPPIDKLPANERGDLPIKNVKVQSESKLVAWELPFSNLASFRNGAIQQQILYLFCKDQNGGRQTITNGVTMKRVFDCKRGLWGILPDFVGGDPSKAITGPVRAGTIGAEHYEAVCRAVTHEEPYLPK